jgi:DNA-binding LytR/AlgR family response regulator
MKIAVCDGSVAWISTVTNNIYSCGVLKGRAPQVIPYKTARELTEDLLAGTCCDLIFLDINPPRTDCREVCREIKSVSGIPVVLMSAKKEPPPWIFEVDAAGYLKKPFSEKTFRSTVEVALKKVRGNAFLYVDSGKFHQYETDSIRYFCSKDHYLHIYTDRDDAFIREGLSNIEKSLLAAGFFRCHRSYLINLNYVRGWNSKAVTLKHPNGDIEVPLSREKRRELRDTILQRYRNIS